MNHRNMMRATANAGSVRQMVATVDELPEAASLSVGGQEAGEARAFYDNEIAERLAAQRYR